MLNVLFFNDTATTEIYTNRASNKPMRRILQERGYDDCLENFSAILRDADLVVANLETPLAFPGQSPYEGEKTYLHWSDPVDAPDALQRHNLGVVLAQHGIASIGAGVDASSAMKPWSRTLAIGAQRFALTIFAAYAVRKKYRVEYRYYAEDERGGVNPLEFNRMAKLIGQLKGKEPRRFVVVFPHWGRNYEGKSASQTRGARELIDAGADLIVGHGAHLMQGIEQYRGRWILYGIGNFVFNSPGRYAKRGVPAISLIARLLVTVRDGVVAKLLRLYPIFTDNLVTDYRSRFVTRPEFDRTWDILVENQGHYEQPPTQGKDAFGQFIAIPLRTP
jgi:hypothetical protein